MRKITRRKISFELLSMRKKMKWISTTGRLLSITDNTVFDGFPKTRRFCSSHLSRPLPSTLNSPRPNIFRVWLSELTCLICKVNHSSTFSSLKWTEEREPPQAFTFRCENPHDKRFDPLIVIYNHQYFALYSVDGGCWKNKPERARWRVSSTTTCDAMH